jgi:hypothetical protein
LWASPIWKAFRTDQFLRLGFAVELTLQDVVSTEITKDYILTTQDCRVSMALTFHPSWTLAAVPQFPGATSASFNSRERVLSRECLSAAWCDSTGRADFDGHYPLSEQIELR